MLTIKKVRDNFACIAVDGPMRYPIVTSLLRKMVGTQRLRHIVISISNAIPESQTPR